MRQTESHNLVHSGVVTDSEEGGRPGERDPVTGQLVWATVLPSSCSLNKNKRETDALAQHCFFPGPAVPIPSG